MTILAAVDRPEPSQRVVRVAYDLATTYSETLVALHVVPLEEFEEHKEAIQSLPEFREYSVTREQDSAADFAERIVESVLGEYDRDVVEGAGGVGNPADEILRETEAIEPRFLVIGGRRRSPVGKAMFGSTTQRILLNADCPVVTMLAD